MNPASRTIGQSRSVRRDTSLPPLFPYGVSGAFELDGEGAVRHGAEEMGVGVPVCSGRNAEPAATQADGLGAAADLRGDGGLRQGRA
jgi:hypothetical protein